MYIHTKMQNNGKDILSWGHVWQLYNRTRSATGLTTLKKLKFEHIYLKMRVDLAAQVAN